MFTVLENILACLLTTPMLVHASAAHMRHISKGCRPASDMTCMLCFRGHTAACRQQHVVSLTDSCSSTAACLATCLASTAWALAFTVAQGTPCFGQCLLQAAKPGMTAWRLCEPVADEFVEDWNGRKLSAKYYAGLTGGSSLRRTKHQWGIRPG